MVHLSQDVNTQLRVPLKSNYNVLTLPNIDGGCANIFE